MFKLLESSLPCPEATLRASLTSYKQALLAHSATEGEAAPFPEFEILRSIAKVVQGAGDSVEVVGDFQVIPEERVEELPDQSVTKVTMRQARLALLGAGLLPTVDAAIAAMSGPTGDAARIEWEYATTLERDWPLVSALADTLGLTDEQLDALFIQAAAL